MPHKPHGECGDWSVVVAFSILPWPTAARPCSGCRLPTRSGALQRPADLRSSDDSTARTAVAGLITSETSGRTGQQPNAQPRRHVSRGHSGVVRLRAGGRSVVAGLPACIGEQRGLSPCSFVGCCIPDLSSPLVVAVSPAAPMSRRVIVPTVVVGLALWGGTWLQGKMTDRIRVRTHDSSRSTKQSSGLAGS